MPYTLKTAETPSETPAETPESKYKLKSQAMEAVRGPAAISAPPPDIDQKAVFEAREKMTKGSPEYIEATKQIAQAQTGTERGAAGWIGPAGKGLAGLLACAPRLRLAVAAGQAVA